MVRVKYDCGPPKLTGACNAVSPTKEVILQPLVSVGGSSGSRNLMINPIPGGGLLGERPVVPGGERGPNEKSNCDVRLRAMQRNGLL